MIRLDGTDKSGDWVSWKDAFKEENEYRLNTKADELCSYGIKPLDDALFRIAKNELVVIGADSGMGKCHGKGTKILMYDGKFKNVEDVVVDDILMGVDSKPRKVLHLHSGSGQLYSIKPSRGNSFVVNGNHVLTLMYQANHAKKIKGQIVNISVLDFINKYKHPNSPHKLYRVGVDFKTQPISVDPYFLGLWLGDGRTDSLPITNKDKSVIDYIYEYARKINHSVSVYKNNSLAHSYAIIKNNHQSGNNYNKNNKSWLYSEFCKLNLFNNKHIPDIYKYNTRDIRIKVLAGLIDTDGYSSGETGYEITIVNKKLAEDIAFVARSLGFFVNFRTRISRIKSINYSCISYRISIVGKCDEIPVKIGYKKARVRKINKNHLLTGFTISKLGNGEYFGFEVSGDHLYLTDDFIVHHNSEMGLNIARHNAKNGKCVAVFYLEGGHIEAMARIKYRDICDEYLKHQKTVGGYIDLDYRKWVYNFEQCTKMQEIEGAIYASYDEAYKDNLFFYCVKAGLNVEQLTSSLIDFCKLEFDEEGQLDRKYYLDLLVIDHLQYFSLDKDENEIQEITKILRTVKNITDNFHIPVILISHLRKKTKDRGLPGQEDFYGSSNIPKISTTSITIAPDGANYDFINGVYPTFFRVPKNRVGMPANLAMKINFLSDRRGYEDKYEVYRLNSHGDVADTELTEEQKPKWAKRFEK